MISFIIPAHDEEELLPATLAAIEVAAEAVGQPYEVIVVDDSSSDRTGTIAREHGAAVVEVGHRQIAATRNAGARSARGQLLLFVDADTRVTESVLRGALDAVAHGAIGGGSAFRFEGQLPLWARILQGVAVPFYRMAGMASGCFLFSTKEAFEAVGGFDEALFGAEEASMSRALRSRGRFVVLQDEVVTSGRKLRAYSAREVLGTIACLALTGGRSMRRRDGLDIWYGPRRADPGAARSDSQARRPTRRCS